MVFANLHSRAAWLLLYLSVALHADDAADEVELPVVDLAKEGWEVAALRALMKDSAFFLMNHGLGGSESGGTVGAAFDAASKLFGLPEGNKSAVAAGPPLPGTSAVRGYLGVGAESGTRASRFECKEGMALAGGKLSADVVGNRWPPGLSDADAGAIELLPEAMRELAILLAEGIAKQAREQGVLSDEDASDCTLGGDGLEVLRIFHYLPHGPDRCSGRAPDDAELVWSSDHTDWGSLTLIAQVENGAGGLELYRDGAYRRVPPLRGALVVNGGDWLELVSHGKLRSPLHRVRQPPGDHAERTAFVYFHYPAGSAPLRPLDIAAAAERRAVAERPSGLVFNTLTNGLDHIAEPLAFKAHLVSKWAGVRSEKKDKQTTEL